MNIVAIVIPVLAGILASASLIVARKPNAKELIDKLVPYQGTIGIITLGWGVWSLIRVLGIIGMMFQISAVAGALLLAIIVLEIIVGFLLGFGLISKYALSGNAQALAKGQAMRAKLAVYQGPLGLALIAVVIAGVVL